MVRSGQLILFVAASIWLPVSSAHATGACEADGSCEAAQGASMLQAKSRRGKIAVEANRTEMRVGTKRRRSKRYRHNGKLMGTYQGNWVTGPFGKCTKGCDPPVKERKVECKNFWDGTESRDCGHTEPLSVLPCSCVLEVCDEAPLNDCTPTPEEQNPGMPGARQETHYTFIGCYSLASDDSTENAGDMMDAKCLESSGSAPCRSGLPFFRDTTATTLKECSALCLGKGLDIFGLVSGEGHSECRCGASILNAEIWHKSPTKAPPPHLLFNPAALTPDDDSDICPMEVYRYTGLFYLGGIPPAYLHLTVQASAYIDSLVKGKIIDPLSEEDDPNKGDTGLVQRAPWDRPCYPSNCGFGRGPWDDRKATSSGDNTGIPDQFEEYIWIPYYFTPEVSRDANRAEAFRAAVKMWMEKTCFVFNEVQSEASASVGIKVGIYNSGSCYAQGMGKGATRINLGTCNDMIHKGNMAHEIGHALGMLHEQARMDAQTEVNGKGPFIDVHWQNIPADWKSEYVMNDKEYMGSASDGPGDPYSGYAPYDFGSIMHYPAMGRFETIPKQYTSVVGQRSELAHSDVLTILDMYQCKLKPGFTMGPTPAPAEFIMISGACQEDSQINGGYMSQGTTKSGATWYKKTNFLALYFEPCCNSLEAAPRWVLDNDDPDTSANSDLDEDGGCMYHAKVDTTHWESYPESASWRVYCPSEGGWKSKTLKIQPFAPTPAPPDPTPVPPTPAPTFPGCIGDAATWDAGFGGCNMYHPDMMYHDDCKKDTNEKLQYAFQVCGECGECIPPPTPVPPPSPPPPACSGTSSWTTQWGDCSTYARGYDKSNFPYCNEDKSNGILAKDACPECEKCSSADPTPAPPTATAALRSESLHCDDAIGEPLVRITEPECLAKCDDTDGCASFSYRPLAVPAHQNYPGQCILSAGCAQNSQQNNWWTYDLQVPTTALVCGSSSSLVSTFESRPQMEQAGWVISWTAGGFKPGHWKRGVPSTSYWGIKLGGGPGEVSLTLQGKGVLTLDYGNSWKKGGVNVYLNGNKKDTAGGNTKSKSVTIPFDDNDVLKVDEVQGIVVINSISFSC